jgi:hypothetical protein
MLAAMDGAQFAEWMAYAGLEPFGEERADLRAGIVASTTANVWRARNKKPLTPRDFMPRFGKKPLDPKTRVKVEVARAMAWVMSVGGKVVQRGKQ